MDNYRTTALPVNKMQDWEQCWWPPERVIDILFREAVRTSGNTAPYLAWYGGSMGYDLYGVVDGARIEIKNLKDKETINRVAADILAFSGYAQFNALVVLD